jgi:hypothetical protein
MRLRFALFFFIAPVLFFSCSTKDTLNPDEDYFLKYYGHAGDQQGVDFVVNPDGTFFLLGNSRATPISDQQIYLAKVDAKGKVIWEKTFGGPYEEEAKDIELLDGNLIVLANSANTNSTDPITRERDVMLLKIGQDGSKIDSVKRGLTVLVDGGDKNDEDAISMSVINGEIFVAGSSGRAPQLPVHKSTFLNMRFTNDLKLYSDVNKGKWKNTPIFTGNGTLDDSGESKTIKILEKDGDFYCFGFTNSTQNGITDFDFCFYALGPTAGSAIGKFDIGQVGIDERLFSVSKISDGYLLTGSSQGGPKGGDIFFVKMNDKIFNNSSINYQKNLEENLISGNYLSAYNFPSKVSDEYYITTEKKGPNQSSDIYFSKWRPVRIDIKPDEPLEKSFGGVGDDFAGPVQELPDGHIAIIGTMTLGGVVDGQRKIVFIKLNSEGRLSP